MENNHELATHLEVYSQWLGSLTTPEVQQSILDCINNLQKHNPSGYYDNLILSISLYLEDRDASDIADTVKLLIETYLDAFSQYGITITEEIPLTELSLLNKWFSALLMIPDYEDVIGLYNIRQLGNSERERFVMICNTIDPSLDEGLILTYLDNIQSIFFDRFDEVLGDRYKLAQSELDQEEDELEKSYNAIFQKAGFVLQKQTTLLRQFKDFLSYFRQYCIYYSDKEDLNIRESLLDLSDQLIDCADGTGQTFTFQHDDVPTYHAVFIWTVNQLLAKGNLPTQWPAPADVLSGSAEYNLYNSNVNLMMRYNALYTNVLEKLNHE